MQAARAEGCCAGRARRGRGRIDAAARGAEGGEAQRLKGRPRENREALHGRDEAARPGGVRRRRRSSPVRVLKISVTIRHYIAHSADSVKCEVSGCGPSGFNFGSKIFHLFLDAFTEVVLDETADGDLLSNLRGDLLDELFDRLGRILDEGLLEERLLVHNLAEAALDDLL